MKNESDYQFFIPKLPPGNCKSIDRQPFVCEARKYIPQKVYNFSLSIKKTYAVQVDFHFIGKPTKDMDNMLKSVFDSLKQWYIIDDIQIRRLVCEVWSGSNLFGVGINIREI